MTIYFFCCNLGVLFKLVTKSAAEFLEEIAIKTIDTSQSSKLEVVKSSIEIEQKKTAI